MNQVSTGKIRVIVVEDQTIVRRGIISLLELMGDIQVVGEAADGEEALLSIATARPDVALMDIQLPKMSSIEVLELARARGIAPPTIFLTTFDDDLLFLRAVRAGAKGFLLKDVSEIKLAEAIRVVAAGGSLLQPAVTEKTSRVLAQLQPRFDKSEPMEALTPYERNVLRLVAGGHSNREIAEILNSSEGAVKNHLSSVLGKLGVRDRTRAVLRGIELGYL
jgi:DNA-binding NarL/FixJ family response regulator